MNTSHVVALNTTGKLAKDLGRPIHRIKWVLKTRGIKHVAVAGNVRLFDYSTKTQKPVCGTS